MEGRYGNKDVDIRKEEICLDNTATTQETQFNTAGLASTSSWTHNTQYTMHECYLPNLDVRYYQHE